MRIRFAGYAVAGLLAFGASTAHGQAIISNGTVMLGVDALGQLNIGGGAPSVSGTTTVGLRFLSGGLQYESTAPGCLCEGWGAGIVGGAFNGLSGFADNAIGTAGLALSSFVSGADFATSVVTIGGVLKVTHAYHPSSSVNLFQVDVSIENISGAAITGDIRYRRLMDWDIEPTPFSEYVTLAGWPATKLLHTTDNGFCSADVLSLCTPIIAPPDANFDKSGVADHGAQFDFTFGSLAIGGSVSFTTFYGAAASSATLLTALGSVGAEIYSMAFCASDPACPAVHTYAFKGVGGTALPPVGVVPEPATISLMAIGIAGVGLVGYRRRRKAHVVA